MGCIFYELITLKVAFDGENIFEISNKLINCKYEEVEKSNENFDFYTKIVKEYNFNYKNQYSKN